MMRKITLLWLLIAACFSVRAQIIPQIVVADSVLCVPSKVDLKVINCNSCVKFEWQVGAGASFKTTSIPNYQTIITSPGWYDVTVIVYTSSGAKLAIGKKKAFFGRPSPAVKFGVNKTTFCKGHDTLILTDSTANAFSRDWLIDGNIYYNTPKTIRYVLNGYFDYKKVYLLVKDSWGCKAGLLKDSLVSVWDSVKVTMNPNRNTGCAPGYVQFNPVFDSAKQTLKSFLWKFEGGTADSSTLRRPLKVYYKKGDTFDVTLKLTTSIGCVYNYKENNLLRFGDTSLLKIFTKKKNVCASERTVFTVSGSRTKNLTWEDKGIAFTTDSLKGKSITVRYLDTGYSRFSVFENDRGCISRYTMDTAVRVLGPIARFNSDYPYYCQIPKKLVFTNKSIEDPKGTTWKWTISKFKGSAVTTGTSKDISYTTSTGTDYDAMLIATGNNGCADTLNTPKASAFGKIDTNFTVKPNPSCPGQVVYLIAKAKSSTVSPNSYKWTFYDEKGKVAAVDNAVKGSHQYNYAGNFSAKLIIWNNEGCKDSLFLKDTIHVVSYTAKISVSDTIVCANQPIKFAATDKYNKIMLNQLWEFINQDSVCDHIFFSSDSVVSSFTKTGRWKISYSLSDTAAKGCYQQIVYPSLIKVNGILADFTSTPTFGCAPLNVVLKANAKFDVNYYKSGVPKYTWKTTYPKNIIIADTTKASTTAVINKGQHPLKLIYENASGCKDSTNWNFLNAGMDVKFSMPNGSCIKTRLKISNNSTSWIQKFVYECNSPEVVFYPSKLVREPEVVFLKPGNYPVKLIGFYNGCSDTFSTSFVANGIVADFTTPDSMSFCAPRLINIINNSKGAVYNKWKFGDNDTAVTLFDELAGHLFTKNNNNGYTISLITKDAFGCLDTLVKPSFIKIIGPEPEFSVRNAYGCEKLHVEFINKSKVFNRMFMDYDNGIVYDSATLKSFDYYVTDKSKKIQYFVPRLLLYDSLGCSALKISDDTIKVLKGPEAKFSYTSANFLRGTEGCANDLLVKFTNLSKFFVKTFWDFDSDKVTDISNQNNPSWFYSKPGVFYPTIVAENFNGCRDTFYRDSFIVWEPPTADFTESTDSSCAIDPVRFYTAAKAKYPIVSYKWNFGEIPIFTDTSASKNPVWKYTTPFDHNVTLDVQDKNGCKNQSVKNIYIFDTAGPKKPDLAYITVRNGGYVDCYWRVSKLGNFLQYHTYLDSISFYKRYTSYNRQDTFVTWNYGNQIDNRRFCFTVRLEDTCNQMGKYGLSHCTIVLRDTIFEPFNIQLNWLAYDWWGVELSHYDVFRKDQANGTFKRIATVKSNRQTFTDSFLCDQDYWYYVEAVHMNGIYKSRSNEIKEHPIYKKPEFTVDTKLVTVEDNDHIRVNWERYPVYYRKFSYSLDRSLSGLPGSFMPFYNGNGLTGQDVTADFNNRIHYYQVRFVDHCNVAGEPGKVSNSIWLRSSSTGRNNTSLVWNAYGFWYSGVKEYNVQLKDQNGVFQNMKTVGPSVVQLDSLDIEKLGLDSICFRVYAIKDTITRDTSFSNELCLVPSSYVIIPNTFTPDDNGLNEIFKPVAGFIHRKSSDPQKRFEFRIYNRWGQEVFYSDNADLGWNGFYQNSLCPPGMYIYTVKALGYDGVPHLLKGTVMLLR